MATNRDGYASQGSAGAAAATAADDGLYFLLLFLSYLYSTSLCTGLLLPWKQRHEGN